MIGSILIKITLTTALALAAARFARRSRASVRHLLLAASFALLMLVPIVSLVAPPVQIHVPVPVESRTIAAKTIETTFAVATSAVTSKADIENAATAPRSNFSMSIVLFAVWLIGTLLFLAPVVAGLWQTRSLKRAGLPWPDGQWIVNVLAVDAGVHRRVELLLHESVPGPMTSGFLRPAILMPIDAQNWPSEELSRAIVHELEHVRRCDWISRCVARVVSALYWFHPIVWAAWRQFVLEAERACDDAVLRRAEATVYADQLVVLAQRLLTSPAAPLTAMANRHDLTRRVAALLDHKQRRGRAGAIGIGLACAASAILVATISPLHIVARQQASPKFEVASVKPCKEEDFQNGNQRRQEYTVTPGRVRVNCLTAQRIVFMAYAGIGSMDKPLLNDAPGDPTHVRGGPGWIRSDTFVIEATAEGTPDRTVLMGPMMRALLEERFKIKTHRETEELPMYALTVAKGGLKIKPIDADGCTQFEAVQNLSPQEIVARDRIKPVCGNFTSLGNQVNRTWILGGTTLTRFASQILSSVLDRYVMDKTGVDGLFNIQVEFGYDDNIRTGVFGGRPVNPSEPPPDIVKAPSIFTVLEEQLGLKLEKAKGPHEFLVIDSVERPSGL